MGKACPINSIVSQGDKTMKALNYVKAAILGASAGATVIALSLGSGPIKGIPKAGLA